MDTGQLGNTCLYILVYTVKVKVKVTVFLESLINSDRFTIKDLRIPLP